MTSRPRSLSATLGAWRVKLVYDARPDEAERALVSSEVAEFEAGRGARRALLPAFAAMLLAVAAACYALAHFIDLPGAARTLFSVLLACMGISWGARCGPPTLRRVCAAARWPAAMLLAVGAFSLRWNEAFLQLVAQEPNVQAAAFSGFINLLSVLLVGARSGGRLVPVAAPLLPALSLFGLLYLSSTDMVTQSSFLVFVGAALYLLCYDRFLRRAAPDLSSGVWKVAPRARYVGRDDAIAWALQSVLVSSVWFALFLGGGALLFWPMQAILPHLSSPRWNRSAEGNGERSLDYSGNAQVMELRGGTHVLSDRIVLRVTALRGVPTGNWRGRVYEKYERSLWKEEIELSRADLAQSSPGTPGIIRLVRPRSLGTLRATPPVLAPGAGTIERISEQVVPLGGVAAVVFSSGQPMSWQARPRDFKAFDPARRHDLTRSQTPYRVQSFETRPNLRVLDAVPGFDAAAGNATLAPELLDNLRRNLQLPDENATRVLLKRVAAQIRRGALPTRTPSEKARAVAEYLRLNCLYSLQAPVVPVASDATAFFLTEAKSGACDMFASSQALLLREMGVPARVATGYLGPQTAESQARDESGHPVTTLRERDAHAWVEYYVPSFGWLSIDPTQNTRLAPTGLAGHLGSFFNFARLHLPPALWALPALGLALLGAGLLWQRRADAGKRQHENERQRIEAAYARAIQLLGRRVPHAPHLAPGEYEARVARANLPAAAKQEFAALTHLYLAAHYGEAPDVTRAQVDDCLMRLQSALRRGARA